MAGIYLHIPFCSSRCIYCDFYSTTFGKKVQSDFVKCLCKELILRREELQGKVIDTIYFGGGTPSLLTIEQLSSIFLVLRKSYQISPIAEITLEANPDDVTSHKAVEWKSLGINRISLGLQTFQDDILKLLRRRHTSSTAREAVKILKNSGLDNLSLDLIYGLPGQTFEKWKEDVDQLIKLDVKHLSAYALSYEEGTMLTRMRDRNEIEEASDELIRAMYLYLIRRTSESGFEHYEISNFCQPGFHSRHNFSYWSGITYLGVGPGAHSYDGHTTRRANLPDLTGYIQAGGNAPFQKEELSSNQLFEEYLMTGMRTSRGISLSFVKENFGSKIYTELCRIVDKNIALGFVEYIGDNLKFTVEGIFISDYIISDFMLAGDV